METDKSKKKTANQQETQPEDNGKQTETTEKTFTQAEVNKIVSERLTREREKNESTYTKALVDIEARENAIAEREKAFAEKEKALIDKENRLFAIKAMKDAGLDDGSSTALNFLDFVVAGENVTQDGIKERVSALKSYLDARVTAGIETMFKANGHTPKGGYSAASDDDTDSIKSAFGLA